MAGIRLRRRTRREREKGRVKKGGGREKSVSGLGRTGTEDVRRRRKERRDAKERDSPTASTIYDFITSIIANA